jgi:hypothetical protein
VLNAPISPKKGFGANKAFGNELGQNEEESTEDGAGGGSATRDFQEVGALNRI